jgi:outer membrane protein assembly factor BamB
LSTWPTGQKAEVFDGRRSPHPAAADLFHSLLITPAAEPASVADPAPAAAVAADAAPADAWPLGRGCLAATGRSAATLRLPLEVAWKRGFEKTAFGAVPVIAGGTIYVGDLDGTFHALDLATGETRWSIRAEAAGFPAAAAVAPDGAVVVVGDDAGLIRGLDAATGQQRWSFETDGEISGGPAILDHAGGPRVLVGSQDASLSCLAVADGSLVWRHTIADQIRCTPTVVRTAAGDRICIAGCDGKLHVVDAETGVAVAAVPIDGPTGTTPAAAAGRVCFGTEGGVFYGIDVAAAAVAWQQRPAANAQAYRSSATIAGDLAIVGSRSRAVEAFALVDGGRRWRQPMRGRVDASPVAVFATGPAAPADGAAAGARLVVIVADAAGRIAALEAATGAAAWEFDAGGGFGGGPAVAADRMVLASDDGTVWCFRSAAGATP